MIHRCQVWVVNAVLGRDRIAENTFQPPLPSVSGSWEPLRLIYHSTSPAALFSSSCFIVHIQPCCRQWAGDGTAGFVHSEDPADFHLTWPTGPLLETTNLLSEKTCCLSGGFDWSWRLMVVCCFYYHLQIKCFYIVSFNVCIGLVLSLQLPGDYSCFLW